MAYLVLLRDSSKTRFICTCDVVEVYTASKEGWTVLRKLDLYRVHDLGIFDLEQLVEQVYEEWGEPGDKILPKRGTISDLLSYFKRLKDWMDENYPEEEENESIVELRSVGDKESDQHFIKNKFLRWALRWGTMAFALVGVFSETAFDGPLKIAVALSTAAALLVLFSGMQSLRELLHELGIRDPIQSLLICGMGCSYWFGSVAGLATFAESTIKSALGYGAGFFVTTGGAFSVLILGALVTFNSEF